MKLQINQEIEVDELLDDINFNYCVGLIESANPEKAIPISRLIPLLAKYFPQLKNYIDGTITTNNR